MNRVRLASSFLLAVCVSNACLAQVAGSDTTSSSSNQPVPVTAQDSVETPHLAATPTWRQSLDRWLQFNDLTYSMRYRSVTDSNNAHEYDHGQQRSIIDGNIKLDRGGKYGITFHLSSGDYFNWAFADFIGGGGTRSSSMAQTKLTPVQQFVFPSLLGQDRAFQEGLRSSGGWALRMRRLYLHAEPLPGVEVQYGSLDINRGAGSEITTYDYDGYIDGGRLLFHKPSLLFFDEAAVTYAYFGDIYTANFFARGGRLTQSNYHQFLLAKHFAKRLQTSVDYTFVRGANTMREAALVGVSEVKAIDKLRFEAYQRVNSAYFPDHDFSLSGGNGFAVTIDKKINSRFKIEAGVANIDIHYSILTQRGSAAVIGFGVNGDQYGLGDRFFVRPTINLTRYLDVNAFYTHTYEPVRDPIALIWNKQALNAGLTFDIKKLLFPNSESK